MKKFFSFLFLTFVPLVSFAQSSTMVLNELENTFLDYNVNPFRSPSWEIKDVNIHYNIPTIRIEINNIMQSSGGFEYHTDISFEFDILKASFFTGKNIHQKTNSSDFNNVLEIYCPDGIQVIETEIPSKNGHIRESKKKLLPQYYTFYTSSKAIVTRVMNGFLNLQTLAKDQNIKPTTPHILDNANLFIGKPTFIDPNNNNKLDANETGLITFKIKNKDLNEAYNIDIYIKDEKKNKGLQYESIHNIQRIKGYEEITVNIPIKATPDINNVSNEFQIKILYQGIPIASNSLFIDSYNKSRISSNGTKTIKMKKMSGNTFLISCKVNSLPLNFIFDTGASSVTLSLNEANFMLKNGYLTQDDIIGKEYYQTASGAIQAGTKVILKKIEIDELVLRNVEASIIHSDNAPLLLGQSALKQLGTIQIDYQNSTLTITNK